MAKYDLEMLLADVKAVMTSSLNTKLAEIDSEKADAITLATVASGSYFFQTMDAEVANCNPFILYGIEDIETIHIGPYGSKLVTITVYLVLEEGGQEANLSSRMLRYLRALEEIYETDWQTVSNAIKIKKQSLVPFELTRLNDSQPCRAVGIRLRADLG